MKNILLVAFLNIFILPLYANSSLSHLSDANICSWFEVVNMPQLYIDEAQKRNLECSETRVKFKIDCGLNSINTDSGCKKIPVNSRKFNSSWVCNQGFKKINDRCESFILPKNAIYSEEGWACKPGYFKQLNSCESKEPKLPQNAYKKGDSFACVTGYYKDRNACRRLPSNAIAFNDRDGYFCESNYWKSASLYRCILKQTQATNSLPVQENSLDDIRQCSKGYKRVQNTCVELTDFKDNHPFFLVFFNSGKPTIYFWLALIFSAIALDNIFSLKRKRKEAKTKLAEMKQNAEKEKIKEAEDLANTKRKEEEAKLRNAEIERRKEEAKTRLAEIKQKADKAKADKAKADKAKADKAIAEKAKDEKEKIIEAEALTNTKRKEEEVKLVNPPIEAVSMPLIVNENSNKSEILDYAKNLIDKSLRDIITDIQESGLEDQYYSYRRYFPFEEDKGLIVDIERFIEKDSEKHSIFENLLDIYGFNMQPSNQSINYLKKNKIILKTIPTRPVTNQKNNIITNDLPLSRVDYYEIIDEIWENSSLFNEIQNLLLVLYYPYPHTKPLDYQIEDVKACNLLEGLPSYYLSQIQNDWELIRDKVRDGRAHFISRKQTKYLVTQNDNKKLNNKVRQPNNTHKANSKIFYLKRECINTLFAVDSLVENRGKNESFIVADESVVSPKVNEHWLAKSGKIPKLQFSGRDREYKRYGLLKRSKVVKDFLFNGESHRQLDKKILGLDPKISKGFQSMGVLHYLGLKKPFSALFYNQSLERVNELLTNDFQNFDLVLKHINFPSDLNDESESFEEESVVSPKVNEHWLAKSGKIPKLKFSGRDREYKRYGLLQRSKVVKDYLFNGTGHQKIDENILNLDSKKSKGLQSMGILHYLGLRNSFSGLFYNQSLERVNELLTNDSRNFDLVLKHINYPSDLNDEPESFDLYHPYYEFHTDFHSLFQNHLGKSEEEIAEFLTLDKSTNKPKNYRRVLVNNLIKVYGQHIEQKNTVLKVIKLESSGKLIQSIPLPTFKYLDIINEEWETSKLFGQLTQKFILIVFKNQEGSDSSILQTVTSWNMSTEDLREAQSVWRKTVSQINLKKADKLPKMSESRVLHVRPHAQNKFDTLPTHYGQDVIKKSFWLNAKFIETFIRDDD